MIEVSGRKEEEEVGGSWTSHVVVPESDKKGSLPSTAATQPPRTERKLSGPRTRRAQVHGRARHGAEPGLADSFQHGLEHQSDLSADVAG